MKKVLVLSLACVVAMVVASCGPDLKQFEPLKNPRIIEMAAQKVIFAETKGNPNVTAAALGELYQIYFGLKIKDKKMVPPMARWTLPANGNKDEMTGVWAVPVPAEVTALPEIKNAKYKTQLGTWEYGTVAEVLYIGPYDKETATIEALHKFIKDSGYVMAGPHEEVYIKGPGMFGKGDPNKYYTIIRNQVKKAGKAKK